MNKNKIIVGAGVLLVIGGLAVMFLGGSPKLENNYNAAMPNGDGNTQAGTATNELKTFTSAYVSGNNSAASCYTIVNGGVYNVTSFIGKHPGGEDKILNLCGKDGSTFFNKQHGGQAKAEAALASLKIGILAQ